MEGIIIFFATLIALFVYFNIPCSKQKRKDYRSGCRLCCEYDLCCIRWIQEELNDEEYLFEVNGYELNENK